MHRTQCWQGLLTAREPISYLTDKDGRNQILETWPDPRSPEAGFPEAWSLSWGSQWVSLMSLYNPSASSFTLLRWGGCSWTDQGGEPWLSMTKGSCGESQLIRLEQEAALAVENLGVSQETWVWHGQMSSSSDQNAASSEKPWDPGSGAHVYLTFSRILYIGGNFLSTCWDKYGQWISFRVALVMDSGVFCTSPIWGNWKHNAAWLELDTAKSMCQGQASSVKWLKHGLGTLACRGNGKNPCNFEVFLPDKHFKPPGPLPIQGLREPGNVPHSGKEWQKVAWVKVPSDDRTVWPEVLPGLGALVLGASCTAHVLRTGSALSPRGCQAW